MKKKDFFERVKERTKEISNVPDYKKKVYARRLNGLLILMFLCVFMPLAVLAEKFLNIPDYISAGVAFFLTMTLALLISEAKAEKKIPFR